MIAVSDSFKKAIKSDVREIHGYVDVTYDKKEGEYSVDTMPTPLILSKADGFDLIDNVKVMKNYGTLENNYLLLDGSFILANKNTLEDSGGFISDDIYNNMSDKTFNIVSSETGFVTTKGFTIFFKDNIVFDFNIHIVTEYGSGGTEDTVLDIPIRNNTRYNYLYVFEEETTIKKFQLTILNVEFQDKRIRIPDINFSLTDVYQNEDLVKFEVNEEIDLLVESLPINTFTINLNNYPDENGNNKFNPISPTGITSYLTENCTLQPFIGVLTEENGIEYVPMGTFYLKDWSSDNDGNVTINAVSLMDNLNNIDIVSDGTFLTNEITRQSLNQYFENMTGYKFDLFTGNVIHNFYLRHTKLSEWLLARLPFYIMGYSSSTGQYFRYCAKVTRDNVVSLRLANEDIISNISRHELLEDVDYATKSVIREVHITDITSYNMSSSTKENSLDDNHTLYDAEEYIWFHFNKYTNYTSGGNFSYNVVSGNGRAELIDINYYMCYIKFTGTIGSVINVKYNAYVYEEPPTKVWKWSNDLKTGDLFSLDFHEYYDASDSGLAQAAYYYLTYDKKYVITANTIGDPSLESGDKINIQTRYNDEYKEMIITKQKFTYDGGLTCELEGRGD